MWTGTSSNLDLGSYRWLFEWVGSGIVLSVELSNRTLIFGVVQVVMVGC